MEIDESVNTICAWGICSASEGNAISTISKSDASSKETNRGARMNINKLLPSIEVFDIVNVLATY